MSENLINEHAAAKWLGIKVATLRNWRIPRGARHHGPPWIKLGEAVRYAPEDIREWLAKRREAVS
jgi:predicted DNA-binding transcriptional regulator AlpA